MGVLEKLFAAFGLVFLIFGGITFALLTEDSYSYGTLHLVIGTILLVLFVVRGGLRFLFASRIAKGARLGSQFVFQTFLFLGIIVLINFAVYRHLAFTIDTTEQEINTLAPQTEEILSRLAEPVVLRAFFLGGTIADPKLEALLNRMRRVSSKFQWEAVDPEKKRVLVERFGINEQGTLHLSYAHADGERQVKITRDYSEEELVKALLKLTRAQERKVYYITGHGEPELSGTHQAGLVFFKEAIEGENIVVEQLALPSKREIPNDAEAILLVAPPRPFLPEEETAVLRYVLRGGGVLMFAEPLAGDALRDLALKFDLEIGRDVVLAEEMRAFEGRTLGTQPVIETFTPHPITKGFSNAIMLTTTSSVRIAPGKLGSKELVELARTGPASWAEKKVDLVFSEDSRAQLEAEDLKGPVPVIAAYSGVLDGHGAPALGEKSKPARVVVFGDGDFISNLYLRQLFNRDFALNALNWVLGEDAPVSIRSGTLRGSSKSLSGEQYSRAFLLGGLLLPEVIILFGLFIWMRRTQ